MSDTAQPEPEETSLATIYTARLHFDTEHQRFGAVLIPTYGVPAVCSGVRYEHVVEFLYAAALDVFSLAQETAARNMSEAKSEAMWTQAQELIKQQSAEIHELRERVGRKPKHG